MNKLILFIIFLCAVPGCRSRYDVSTSNIFRCEILSVPGNLPPDFRIKFGEGPWAVSEKQFKGLVDLMKLHGRQLDSDLIVRNCRVGSEIFLLNDGLHCTSSDKPVDFHPKLILKDVSQGIATFDFSWTCSSRSVEEGDFGISLGGVERILFYKHCRKGIECNGCGGFEYILIKLVVRMIPENPYGNRAIAPK